MPWSLLYVKDRAEDGVSADVSGDIVSLDSAKSLNRMVKLDYSA